MLIVGAGSAGSVIAEQLSADPSCLVTVLEAGPDLADPVLRAQSADGLRLPIGAASPLVQRYQTQLTEDPVRLLSILRGSTVGGSGAVNGGYFCRGLPRDFRAIDAPEWAWPDVLRHFRSIETDLDFDGPAHGDSGPIAVRRTSELVGVSERFVTAAQAVGFPWIMDVNDVDADQRVQSGVGAVPLNIVDGVRNGSGAAYLTPALGRPNLNLVAATRSVSLLFNGTRVIGVQAVGPRGPVTATADRVILCAGAIESAHLLMASGVGDETMLRAAGIQPVAPLPVGMGCSDHPEWLLSTNWVGAEKRPVLEVILITGDLEIRPYTGGFVALTENNVAGEPDWPHIGVALMRPRSRGRVSLVSADPLAPPRIEHRYDSEPDDVAALRQGSELVREICHQATDVGPPVWATSQHLCGSAPIGKDTDPRAVVDHQCRVHGVENLWVADGSVLPTIPSRGPHATIVMLAHRVAELLK